MAVYVIGIDGGTESIRAGVFDLQGLPLGFCATPYPTTYPQVRNIEPSPQPARIRLCPQPVPSEHPGDKTPVFVC
jgi:sugar (pentulose or hexulose) kinase